MANAFITSPPATRVAMDLSPGFHFGRSAAQSSGSLPGGDHLEFGAFFRICGLVGVQLPLPLLLCLSAFADGFTEKIEGIRGQEKLLGGGPVEGLLCGQQFVLAQRIAMRREIVLLLRAAVADMRVNQDQGRLVGFRLRLHDGRRDVLHVIALQHYAGVPAIAFETLLHVFGEAKVRAARERDAVLVVKRDELTQLQMSGKRCRFLGDAFHQAAIAARLRMCGGPPWCGRACYRLPPAIPPRSPCPPRC